MAKQAAVFAKIGDITGAKVVLEVYYYEVTVDPLSLAAEAGASLDVTIAGLTTNDMVFFNPRTAMTDNFIIASARVSTADTLTLTFANNNVAGGAAIDIGSSTWKVLVIRPKA